MLLVRDWRWSIYGEELLAISLPPISVINIKAVMVASDLALSEDDAPADAYAFRCPSRDFRDALDQHIALSIDFWFHFNRHAATSAFTFLNSPLWTRTCPPLITSSRK